ncbi:hypothetical protein D3C72_1155040 [compost metagenome]
MPGWRFDLILKRVKMSGPKKYQVFVSSTFVDLQEERQAVIRHILDLKHIPAGMELFPAADVKQLDYIKKIIDECDYYVLIVGGRYGSMDESGVSYTEREYDYAVETGKVVLAFVHDDVDGLTVRNSEANHAAKLALSAFRTKVMAGRLVSPWRDQQSLELTVLKALMHAFNDFPKIGWIRGDAIATRETIEKSNRLLEENAVLKENLTSALSSSSPQLENLAELDDLFEFRYTYRREGKYAPSYPSGKKKLSWRSIFLGVGAQLDVPRTAVLIASGVKAAMKDADGSAMHSLDETDRTRIKIQLEALGLISSRVSKSTDGKYAEFLSLTNLGKRTLVEGLAVRKATAN